MLKSRSLAVLVLVAVPALARAQASPQAPSAPAPAPAAAAASAPAAAELPKPAPELQKLAFLVGDWVHDEVYEASPLGPSGKGAGRSRNQWVLGDHHLYMVYTGNRPMGKMEGRGFLHWDAPSRSYALDWFDNTGVAFHYRGDFGPDGTLVLGGEYDFQGQHVKEQIAVQRQDDGQIKLKSAVAVGSGAELKTVAESTLSAPKK